MQDVSEETVKISFDGSLPFCISCAGIRRNRSSERTLGFLTTNGCAYCALLAKISQVYFDKNRETETINGLMSFPGNILWLGDNASNIFSEYIGLYVPEGTPSKALVELLGTGRNPCGKTDVITRISHARNILERCEHEHEECRKTLEAEDLPRRLLKLSESFVQLVETLETLGRSDVKYSCLSYCWGESQPLTLTGANHDEFRRGIFIDSIPQTLRDAIRVTQGLGLQYIWIDALCIVQDDRGDWDKEAPRMGSIYRSAHVTIAASYAISCREGFLADVSDRWKKHTHVQCVNVDGVVSDVFVRPEDPTATAVLRGWATRGWTLQESIFSRRLLSFEEHEFRWRCNQTHLREFSAEDPLSRDEKLLASVREGSWDAWSWFVKSYLQRSFTHEGDRLVAISGFVLELIRATGQKYYAGHFSGPKFIHSLLWHNSTGDHYRRAQPYQAPSWSWASLVCESSKRVLMFPGSVPPGRPRGDKLFVPSAHVLDIWTESSAPYGTGAVKAGQLTLGAWAFKSKLSRNLDPDAEYNLGLCPDIGLLLSPDRRAYLSERHFPRRYRLDYEVDLTDPIDILCLRMGTMDSHYHYWLLCVTAPNYEDSYERIGIVEFRARLNGDIEELGKSQLKETWMEVKIV